MMPVVAPGNANNSHANGITLKVRPSTTDGGPVTSCIVVQQPHSNHINNKPCFSLVHPQQQLQIQQQLQMQQQQQQHHRPMPQRYSNNNSYNASVNRSRDMSANSKSRGDTNNNNMNNNSVVNTPTQAMQPRPPSQQPFNTRSPRLHASLVVRPQSNNNSNSINNNDEDAHANNNNNARKGNPIVGGHSTNQAATNAVNTTPHAPQRAADGNVPALHYSGHVSPKYNSNSNSNTVNHLPPIKEFPVGRDSRTHKGPIVIDPRLVPPSVARGPQPTCVEPSRLRNGQKIKRSPSNSSNNNKGGGVGDALPSPNRRLDERRRQSKPRIKTTIGNDTKWMEGLTATIWVSSPVLPPKSSSRRSHNGGGGGGGGGRHQQPEGYKRRPHDKEKNSSESVEKNGFVEKLRNLFTS